MIARTSPAMKMPLDWGVPLKSGMKPSVSCSHGSRWLATNGPSTRIPQSPSTTLGIAASVSTSAPTMPPTPRGASSLRKSAIAIASGDRDHERDQRRDGRAEETGQRAVDVVRRVPGAAPEEGDAELVEGEARLAEDLQDDRDHHGDRGQRRERGQAEQRAVAEPVAHAAAVTQAFDCGNGAHERATVTAKPAFPAGRHQTVTRSQRPVSPRLSRRRATLTAVQYTRPSRGERPK